MRILRGTLCLIVLSTAVGTLVLGQTASGDFPNEETVCNPDGNVPPAASGQMSFTVVARGIPNVRTNDLAPGDQINLSPCEMGDVVATKAANAICKAAVAKSLTCSGDISGVPCGPGLGCCAATIADSHTFICRAGGAGTMGFRLNRDFTGLEFTVSPAPGNLASEIQNLNCSTPVGNPVRLDPLPQYLVGVNPRGFTGDVVFKVRHNQGGQSELTFSRNPVNFSTLHDFHVSVANGFSGLNLSVPLVASVHQVNEASDHSRVTESFTSPFVLLSNIQPAQVIDVSVNAPTGMQVTVEMGTPGGVPALNGWGVVVLVGFLILSGVWFVNRGGRPLQA